ncbi:MAG: SCO family protein [Deltaproteobacteria bacterium]|nr:SCO family protein [Deltaproteobacteria bacterium]
MRHVVLGLCAGAIGWPWLVGWVSMAPASVAAEPAAPTAARPAKRSLTFIDHRGRAVNERDFLGSYMLVFFGYTACPDVCPADLAIMSAAMRHLGAAAESVQPVFITFDPDRDTPEVLAGYLRHFHPRLIGLTGTPDQIAAAVHSYGVVFEREEEEGGAEGSGYSLRHTALTYLIGPDGKGVTMFDHGSDPREMADEILAQLEKAALASAAGGTP